MHEDLDNPARRRTDWRYHLVTLLMVAAVLLLGAGVLCVGSRPGRGTSANPRSVAPEPVLRPFCEVPHGEPAAAVQVLAMLPVSAGCQDTVGLYLLDVVQRHEGRMGLRLFDMKSSAAQRLMQQHGVKCACVIINGKTRFDLGGATGKVLLEGPMDLADVRLALLAELRAAYGESVPGLPPVPQEPSPGATRGPTPERK